MPSTNQSGKLYFLITSYLVLLLVALSILSYDAADFADLHYPPHSSSHNFFGIFGAYFARYLLFCFGTASYLLLLGAAIASALYYKSSYSGKVIVSYFVVAFFWLSGLVSFIVPITPSNTSLSPGGVIGLAIVSLLNACFGSVSMLLYLLIGIGGLVWVIFSLWEHRQVVEMENFQSSKQTSQQQG